MSQNGTLTPTQTKALRLLLSGEHISHVAPKVGVTEHTIYRWYKLEAFSTAYDAGQRAIFEEVLQSLRLRVRKAIDTLTRIMGDENAPHASQVRAASIILEQAIATYKLSELEQRVKEVEAKLKEKEGSSNGHARQLMQAA